MRRCISEIIIIYSMIADYDNFHRNVVVISLTDSNNIEAALIELIVARGGIRN